MQPDFICIGAQKAGTSWLYKQLSAHPDVSIPSKESNILTLFKGPRVSDEFAKFYADSPQGALKGDICPNYAGRPVLASKAGKFAPAAKYIFIIRDPVDRAWSQYKMATAKGRLSSEISWAEAFETNTKGMQYRGSYTQILADWSTALPATDMLCLPFEWIADRPKDLLGKVFDHLNLPHHFDDELMATRPSKTDDRPIEPDTADTIRKWYHDANKGLGEHLWWTPDWLK